MDPKNSPGEYHPGGGSTYIFPKNEILYLYNSTYQNYREFCHLIHDQTKNFVALDVSGWNIDTLQFLYSHF